MADWSLPSLTSTYSDFLTFLKARDDDSAKMFDGVGTNLPSGTIRWNSTNNYFEKFNGTTWSILTARLIMTSDKLYNAAISNSATINDAAAAATNILWTSSKINTFAGGFYTKTEIDAFRSNYLLKNGENGTLTFGTNDASAVNIETANANRLSISGTGNVTIAAPSTGVALSVTPASGQNAITASGPLSGTTLVSTVATGTAPLTVASTTKVTNLNADLLDGFSATNANTANTVVNRDASGNFSAGTITAALSGNATTATTLATARTIGISGGATGTATSFNGGANITIPVTSVDATYLSGTIPDARISGSYTGMTNLTGSGTVDFAKFLGNAADTVAAPSFSWTGDDNTGIYQPAADQVAITTGGVQRALFSSTGISGVGSGLTSLTGNNIVWATAAAAGKFDTSTTTPTGTTRLNYGGYFYPTFLNLTGSSDTTTAATHYFVETGSDGFVRPKTLADVKAEIAGDRLALSGGTVTGLTIFSAGISASTITETSDRRLKENIEVLSNSLSKVKKLQGVSYNLVGNEQTELGLIAQEVEEVVPEVVQTDSEGMKSVSYSRTVALLIEAVKEQQEMIENLKDRVKTLEEK